MKKALFTISIILSVILGFAQQTITGYLEHDSISRSFITYIPDSYTGDTAVPIVFNFHGYGSDANAQMYYGDFRSIADTAGFIVVHPQGTRDGSNTRHWNVGGWTSASTVNDVGFIDDLLDTLIFKYNIDLSRIYSTGMSNGGFMSYLLACQLSDRFAAVASVTGAMTNETYNQCNPTHPTPILQIHGTDDPTVPYYGGFTPTGKSVEVILDYWKAYNNTNVAGDTIILADIDTTDGCDAEYIWFENGDSAATVEHFKINAGLHTWPGSSFSGAGTNNDIDASVEIWKFFSKYNLIQLGVTPVMPEPYVAPDGITINNNQLGFRLSPNPANSHILITGVPSSDNYEIYNNIGSKVLSGTLSKSQQMIDVNQLERGIYFVKIGNQTERFIK